METLLLTIAAKIAACCIDPIVTPVGQWLCYPFKYNSNIKTLEDKVQSLKMTRDHVTDNVASAENKDEEIQARVRKWLDNVDKTIAEATQVLEVEEMGHTWCSIEACLKLVPRHRISSKAKNIVEDIDEAMKKYDRFEKDVSRPATQEIATPRHSDYMDSESTKSNVKRLKEALRNDKIHVIGVWGMPGVGKTMLVREVKRQAKEEKLFDEVALANVTNNSLDSIIKRIQGEIADALHLKFDEGCEYSRRASRLRERLSQDRKEHVILDERLTRTKDKKILVILDDIWEKLDLVEIGIPYEGCKLLLTSRNREVLVCGMGTQKDFGLGVLGKEEAWSLFEKMAGDRVKDPNLGRIATEVANECAGLPLALVTVSKALKDKKLMEWKNALRKLRRPSPKNLTKMQSTIYNSVELSYNHLESEAKAVFLLCAQQGYNIYEMDLLKYCYGLGLFHGVNTMEEVRENLYTNVRILKDCCLLLHTPYSSKILRMHDVVRDAAKLIASRDQNMFVVGDDGGLKEWPDANALKTYVRFSVHGGDISEVLPNEMECPELTFLYAYGRDLPLQISNDTFFEGMGNLQVLNFTKIQLSSLPSSFHLLQHLQTLCLDHCVLKDIAAIGKLKNLAVLSLHKSHILQLPREIRSLTRLRLLDLSNCSKLEVIPPDVLSSLVALEELYMRNSFAQWEAEGLNTKRNNASLAELKSLSHLITLEIDIPDASNLPKDLLFEKLERYVILIGDVWDLSDSQGEASRTLKFKLNASSQLEVGFKMLLKRTKNLFLDELKGVTCVLNELDREGFQPLKHLHIQNNIELKCIIDSRKLNVLKDVRRVNDFPVLETSILKNMTGLEEICRGQLELPSFGNLSVVKVEHCDKLKFVFSSSIARGLLQLEELEIRECSIMGAIVMKEEGEIEDTDLASLFPQLRHLALEHLPKLMSLLSIQNSLETYAEEIMSEGKPDFHMPILHEQVVFPNLERLQLSSIGLKDIQHNQQETWPSSILENMSRFQKLLELEVKGCGNIKYLLSFSTAKSMVHLKELSILECKAMEVILLKEDLGVVEEIIPEVLFPRLEALVLKELPLLERFCQGSNIKFPSLKSLVVDHCPKFFKDVRA